MAEHATQPPTAQMTVLWEQKDVTVHTHKPVETMTRTPATNGQAQQAEAETNTAIMAAAEETATVQQATRTLHAITTTYTGLTR